MRGTIVVLLLLYAAAVAAAGSRWLPPAAAAQRIRRLIDPPGTPSPARRALTSATLGAVSIVALAAPVLALITITHCPPGPYVPGW